MRRLFLIFAVITASCLTARAQVDSASVARMDALLDEYLAALETEPVEVKSQECDFLIGTCTDSLLRQRTALRLYSHYIASKLMGDEAVAIDIYDRWIATGKVRMLSEMDEMNASVFAQFNRRSLIGCDSPVLDLQSPDGSPVTIGGPSDRRRVLYFYDTDCPKCKLESIILKSYLQMCEAELDLYAVYVGSDADAWAETRKEKLEVESQTVRVFHAWDPDSETDMQMAYGILQTPCMFLLDEAGVIVGRKLNTEALQKLVAYGDVERELQGRSKVGDRLPDLTLPGTLMKSGKSKEKDLNLRRLKGSPAYLVLYSEGCGNCRRELDRLDEVLSDGKSWAFLVDVDSYMADDLDKGRILFDAFDLSTLPQIISVDRKGRITDRYITFQ